MATLVMATLSNSNTQFITRHKAVGDGIVHEELVAVPQRDQDSSASFIGRAAGDQSGGHSFFGLVDRTIGSLQRDVLVGVSSSESQILSGILR